ncbi:hypothetical protein [Microlunatus soli]|uniref:Secreted protein n=1 Tax=Microlunatus soli TaxID=630515 RepID=A0A1H2AL48_9ACTN|nr:hypothetical protein [Microlunatus soli]SDT46482.1 hypothetical protein SAMN04489812_6016 [Microlunatus soli]
MIKRLLWFAIGAAVGIFAIKKVRDYLAKARPDAVGQRVRSGLADRAEDLSGTASSFVDRARAAMAEREAELRDALGQPQTPAAQPTDDSTEH